MDIQQPINTELRELHLFAGAGGGILAGQLLGHKTVCAVECEPYAQAVLVARQNDGSLPPFPIWSDVQTFDGKPWRGIVDVVSGGFPCQDISVAGKGAGLDGERSGLWREMARIVGEVRPRFVFVENSPALVIRGLGQVLSDLAALGYDCRWTVLGAADIGAPHQRDRFWMVAHASGKRCGVVQPDGGRGEVHDKHGNDSQKECGRDELKPWIASRGWWDAEPGVVRVADELADGVDRLKAIGNGQVPQCAATAWRILGGGQ